MAAAAAAAEAGESRDTDPGLTFSPYQRFLHDTIDHAIAETDGFGGVHGDVRRMGTTTALVMYAKKDDTVALEVDNGSIANLLEQKYAFLKGRVFVHWETPISSTAKVILVDGSPVTPCVSTIQPNTTSWSLAPRFVVFPHSTTLHIQEKDADEDGTEPKDADEDGAEPMDAYCSLSIRDMLTTYARNCVPWEGKEGPPPDLDRLVYTWFAYSDGRSAKACRCR